MEKCCNKIGFITEGDDIAIVSNMKGYFVNPSNPNNPDSESSPNYPRADRVSGYQNPLLGDPGTGEIARWHKVRTDSIHSLLEQMIEQYARDRDWYSTVRCREALWNMYRRLEWWVNQNVGSDDPEYLKALSFIKDGINQILDPQETPKIIFNHRFAMGMESSFTYDGDWYIDSNGYLRGDYSDRSTDDSLDIWSIKKEVEYIEDGLITFKYAAKGQGREVGLWVDGELVWLHDYSESASLNEYTFRDVTLAVSKGKHLFEWRFLGMDETSKLLIDEVIFTELTPSGKKDKDIPLCPLPYEHHFSSDYFNTFDGTDHTRPTFTTKGSSKISDYLDMIRYVSSTEDIEWEQISNFRDDEMETIFKLPLERLPETLSSKMTFNWRLKRRGFITFKYWVDGGNGSTLSFYINNQLVGGHWKDTEGWSTATFNMSQGQTYKFDFLINKQINMNVGNNAVYIKDIEVVEVTKYDDSPMPMDYTEHGENAESEFGKWLIYSHLGTLGTYYRGFPDGEEDTYREIEFELFSECDGVFSFEYNTGSAEPDRESITEQVFNEPHDLTGKIIEWGGDEVGKGVPKIIISPNYGGGWTNIIPEDDDDFKGNTIWTKDSDRINYHIEIEGDWDGASSVSANLALGIFCPPKVVAEEQFSLNPNTGRWYTNGEWDSRGSTATADGYDISSGAARYKPNSNTSLLNISVTEELKEGEYLAMYLNGSYYKRIDSGVDRTSINVPVLKGDEVEFKVIKKEDEDEDYSRRVFSGVMEFDGDYYPLRSDIRDGTSDLDIDAEYHYSSGYGREVTTVVPSGVLESKSSWYTDRGFQSELYLLPGDEVILRIPNTKVPYVDENALAREIEDYIKSQGSVEPEQVFFEDFNPFNSSGLFSFDRLGSWKIVDIFDYLKLPNHGDSVILSEDGGIMYIDLSNQGLDGGNCYLNLEYGGMLGSKSLKLYARVKGDLVLVHTFTESTLKATGYYITGMGLPKNTDGLVFAYS